MMAETPQQPPRGAVPRDIWVEKRLYDVMRACLRFVDAGRRPRIELIEEVRDHAGWLIQSGAMDE